MARLPNNAGWSAPSAIATGGIGFGSQVGIELTDFVFVLNSDAAVRTFTQSGSITLGRNISVAFGPYGRSAEVGGAVGSKGIVGMFAYSKSRGVFGGKSLEGGMMGERLEANKKLYGTELSSRQLLSGNYPAPEEASSLLRLLNTECFQPIPVDTWTTNGSVYNDTTAKLPTKTSPEVAELPAEAPHDAPLWISELDAGELKKEMPAELDAASQHVIHELPADEGKIFYELDASQSTSGEKSTAITGRP